MGEKQECTPEKPCVAAQRVETLTKHEQAGGNPAYRQKSASSALSLSKSIGCCVDCGNQQILAEMAGENTEIVNG